MKKFLFFTLSALILSISVQFYTFASSERLNINQNCSACDEESSNQDPNFKFINDQILTLFENSDLYRTNENQIDFESDVELHIYCSIV